MPENVLVAESRLNQPEASGVDVYEYELTASPSSSVNKVSEKLNERGYPALYDLSDIVVVLVGDVLL